MSNLKVDGFQFTLPPPHRNFGITVHGIGGSRYELAVQPDITPVELAHLIQLFVVGISNLQAGATPDFAWFIESNGLTRHFKQT